MATNSYTVYIKPQNQQPLDSVILVREGFSWLAALLTLFWMLYNRVWIAAVAILAYNVAIALIQEWAIISDDVVVVLNSIALIIIGYYANDWYRWALARRGYVLTDIVSASNEEQAEQRFYDHYLQEHSPA